MKNDHVKRIRKEMMKSSPTINISKVQEKMREEKENINHFEDQELHAPQKRHPMPLPLDLYNQLENSEPNKPKLFTLVNMLNVKVLFVKL